MRSALVLTRNSRDAVTQGHALHRNAVTQGHALHRNAVTQGHALHRNAVTQRHALLRDAVTQLTLSCASFSRASSSRFLGQGLAPLPARITAYAYSKRQPANAN